MLESVQFLLESLRPWDWAWLAVSLALVTISDRAFHRRRGFDTSLMLIGSSALLAEHVFWDLFMLLVIKYQEAHPTSAFANLFYPGDASAPWTSVVALILLAISLLWLVGALVCLLRVTRTHLTNRSSEPLAAPMPRTDL
jgi:hypothetical protein